MPPEINTFAEHSHPHNISILFDNKLRCPFTSEPPFNRPIKVQFLLNTHPTTYNFDIDKIVHYDLEALWNLMICNKEYFAKFLARFEYEFFLITYNTQCAPCLAYGSIISQKMRLLICETLHSASIIRVTARSATRCLPAKIKQNIKYDLNDNNCVFYFG